jgi:hypothetical protein
MRWVAAFHELVGEAVERSGERRPDRRARLERWIERLELFGRLEVDSHHPVANIGGCVRLGERELDALPECVTLVLE